MNLSISLPDEIASLPAFLPYRLFHRHVRPALDARRKTLDKMYDKVMGRPEVDPVLLAGITVLQMMMRLPDRAAIEACLYDVRWRMALELPQKWQPIHPTTLCHFRQRLTEHGNATVALNAGLDAMRQTGYLKRHGSVRIDSTHILGAIAHMSRLECVRETLRLALEFLEAWGGPSSWEPWFSRYADRNPQELRNASVDRLRTTMHQAGTDSRDVLAKALALGDAVSQAEPIRLLQCVFEEQFEVIDGIAEPQQRRATPAGAVHNPHDPEASWSTKKSMGEAGWVGNKLQVCETAPEQPRQPGEPTEAVITAVVTQPAITSDHGSLIPVLAAHETNGQLKPDEVFADAGFISAPALEQAATDGIVLTGPVGAPPHSGDRFGSDAFLVDIPNRQATCPAGRTSTECSRITETNIQRTCFYFAWSATDCAACPLKEQCLSKKKKGLFRTLQVQDTHMQVQERRTLCKNPDYQKRMRRRNGIEGTQSELTRGYGARRSRYRGRKRTDVQMQFIAAACNLRRWAARLFWVATKTAAAA